jgi:hypothetical protein
VEFTKDDDKIPIYLSYVNNLSQTPETFFCTLFTAYNVLIRTSHYFALRKCLITWR